MLFKNILYQFCINYQDICVPNMSRSTPHFPICFCSFIYNIPLCANSSSSCSAVLIVFYYLQHTFIQIDFKAKHPVMVCFLSTNLALTGHGPKGESTRSEAKLEVMPGTCPSTMKTPGSFFYIKGFINFLVLARPWVEHVQPLHTFLSHFKHR